MVEQKYKDKALSYINRWNEEEPKLKQKWDSWTKEQQEEYIEKLAVSYRDMITRVWNEFIRRCDLAIEKGRYE